MFRFPLEYALLCAALIAASAAAQPPPIKLTTDKPGNLFAPGATVVIGVQAAGTAPVSWRATDFAGTEVGKGQCALTKGKGSIELPGLPRGYYEVSATGEGAAAKLSFGVITDHSAADPPSGRLNVDAASAWLIPQEQYEPAARMLRMAGIGWVRERFSWGGTEPEKGEVNWQQYDRVADVLTAQGIRVYQIFHDSPGWSLGGKKDTRNPQDLRDLFAFTKRLAEHYKGRVKAWEIWNEPDIGFWPDLGDTYAGLAKAAYLGFKAGDPDLPVLLGSFCRGYCPFDDSLFEAGIGDYFDIFNWHCYSPPEAYAGTLGRYLQLLGEHGCGERPVWLTECGIGLPATQPGGELSAADEHKQAEFIPRSFASSLAAGTDRHFFFVCPYYLEGPTQFGSLRKDLSPRPSFIAIAAAVDILGEAKYLGRCEFGAAEGVTGLAFDSGKQRVLVIWSAKPQTVELETGAPAVEIADRVGARSQRATTNGKLKLDIGPSAQYVIGLGEAAAAHITGAVRAPGKLPTNHPCPVVLRGQAQGVSLDKSLNCYMIGAEPFKYTVEVCNFSADKPAAGRVYLELQQGWACEPPEARVSLEPMGRALCEFTLSPGRSAGGLKKVWARADLGDLKPAPSVSYFRVDPTKAETSDSLDLGLNDPKRWTANVSGNGKMEVLPSGDGGVRFAVHFTQPGDRWCYPKVDFEPPTDFSKWDGIVFEYRNHGDDPSTMVRLQVWEAGGSAYINGGWQAKKDWTRAACTFADMTWGGYSAADPNGKLDLNAIKTLMIGLNTPKGEAALEVRNVKLVKWGE